MKAFAPCATNQQTQHTSPAAAHRSPQLQVQYAEAAEQYWEVVSAERATIPTNWPARLLAMGRLVKCLALSGQGDSARFESVLAEWRQIQRVIYGKVR